LSKDADSFLDFEIDITAIPGYAHGKQQMYDRKIRDAIPKLTAILMREMDVQGYVPMDTGATARSAQTASNLEDGEIIYDTPYARKIYYGDRLNFSQENHAHVTHHWDQAYWADHGSEIVEMAKKLIVGGA
jgi:hypothetical protein